MFQCNRSIQYQNITMIMNHCRAVPTLGTAKCPVGSRWIATQSGALKAEEKNVSSNLSLSKSSMEKDDTCSEMESSDNEQWMYERHIQYHRGLDFGTDTDSSVDPNAKSWHNRDKELPVIGPVNDRFQYSLDYRKYGLADKSPHYNDEVAWSVANGPSTSKYSWSLKYSIHST